MGTTQKREKTEKTGRQEKKEQGRDSYAGAVTVTHTGTDNTQRYLREKRKRVRETEIKDGTGKGNRRR